MLELSFGLGGARLASLGSDETVTLWDVGAGRRIARFGTPSEEGGDETAAPSAAVPPGALSGVGTAAFAYGGVLPDIVNGAGFAQAGKVLLVGGLHGVRRVDARDGRRLAVISRAPLEAMSVDPRDDTVVTRSAEGTVRLLDARTGRERARHSADPYVTTPPVLRAGRVLLTSDAKVWLPSSRKRVSRLADTDATNGVLSDDGKVAALLEPAGTVSLWDAGSGVRFGEVSAGASAVLAVALAPGGRDLVSAHQDGTVLRWTMPSRVVSRTPTPGAEEDSGSIQVGFEESEEDGRSTIPFTDTRTGRTVKRTFASGAVGVTLADRGRIAFADHGRLEVVDMRTGRTLSTLEGGTRARNLRLSANRRSVAGLFPQEGEAVVWDLPSGRRRYTLSGHESFLLSAAFSVGGGIWSPGRGPRALRDARTGELLIELPGGGTATFGRGGQTVRIVGMVTVERRCDACADWAELVRRIDGRATPALSARERRTYLR